MSPAFQELDVVTALAPVPAEGEDAAVRVGQVGTIVHIATKPDLAYLVEFCNGDGETLAMPFMRPEQIAAWTPEVAATAGRKSGADHDSPPRQG